MAWQIDRKTLLRVAGIFACLPLTFVVLALMSSGGDESEELIASLEPDVEVQSLERQVDLGLPDPNLVDLESEFSVAQAAQPTQFEQNRSDSVFEPLRNNNPLFREYSDVPASQVSLDYGLEPADKPDDGPGGAAFRVFCAYSHFNYDDPIIFPGQPGKGHLHMFFGNTNADAFTTKDSLINSGGGSCQGGVLNRSAYWTPALLDGKDNVVVPDHIVVYYKTNKPSDVKRMPQGLEIVAGNTSSNGFTLGDPTQNNRNLFWSCGSNGNAYDYTNRIPDCGGDTINASVIFPDCWNGQLKYSRNNFAYSEYGESCPSSHPTMIPKISILLYYPGTDSVDGWHLSSDAESYRTGSFVPGGSLHADWFGGWNDEVMDTFIGNCLQADRNCTVGQTGTNRKLTTISNRHGYEGENVLKLPAGSYTPHSHG